MSEVPPLNVSAVDRATGKSQKVTITASSGLSDADIERMVDEAAKNEGEDKAKREAAETRNQLDSVIYQIEKLVTDSGDKLAAADREALASAIADAKKALESDDVERMKAAKQSLEQTAHRASEALYRQAAPGAGVYGGGATAGGGGQSQGEAKRDDNVIDAEFEQAS